MRFNVQSRATPDVTHVIEMGPEKSILEFYVELARLEKCPINSFELYHGPINFAFRLGWKIKYTDLKDGDTLVMRDVWPTREISPAITQTSSLIGQTTPPPFHYKLESTQVGLLLGGSIIATTYVLSVVYSDLVARFTAAKVQIAISTTVIALCVAVCRAYDVQYTTTS
jgi:hypothetical protein